MTTEWLDRYSPPTARRAHYPSERFWNRVRELERALKPDAKSSEYTFTEQDVNLDMVR